jgi:hypothetical protein
LRELAHGSGGWSNTSVAGRPGVSVALGWLARRKGNGHEVEDGVAPSNLGSNCELGTARCLVHGARPRRISGGKN